MSPLSIILIFALLGLMVILGAVVVAFSARKLRQQLYVVHQTRWPGMVALSLDVLLLVFGLILAIYGILGTYRIIYGI